jgi:hypothetical protein
LATKTKRIKHHHSQPTLGQRSTSKEVNKELIIDLEFYKNAIKIILSNDKIILNKHTLTAVVAPIGDIIVETEKITTREI